MSRSSVTLASPEIVSQSNVKFSMNCDMAEQKERGDSNVSIKSARRDIGGMVAGTILLLFSLPTPSE